MRRALYVVAALSAAAVLLVSNSKQSQRTVTTKPTRLGRISKLPVYFVENQSNDSEVKYYVHGGNTSVTFGPDAVTYRLRKPSRKSHSILRNAALSATEDEQAVVSDVRLEFVGVNPHPAIVAHGATGAVFNYFRGAQDQWKTGMSSYSAIVYREVWPGIDVSFDGPDGNLKYTFTVHPGADPSRIRFRYAGASRIALAGDGRQTCCMARH